MYVTCNFDQNSPTQTSCTTPHQARQWELSNYNANFFLPSPNKTANEDALRAIYRKKTESLDKIFEFAKNVKAAEKIFEDGWKNTIGTVANELMEAVNFFKAAMKAVAFVFETVLGDIFDVLSMIFEKVGVGWFAKGYLFEESLQPPV